MTARGAAPPRAITSHTQPAGQTGNGRAPRARAPARLAAVLAAGALVALAAPREAAAQTGRTTQGFFVRNAYAVRVNPLGLFGDLRLGHRWRLFASDESFFRTTFVAVGAQATVSPAFARGGVALEIQPLSILNLSVVYEAGGYFSTFGLMQSFPSANTCTRATVPMMGAPTCSATSVPAITDAPVFSDAEISRRGGLPAGDAARNYPTYFHQVTVGALFQIRFGDLIIRSNNRFVYQEARLRDGDRVFYDQFWDMLFPNRGWIYVNDIDLMYEPIPNLRIGVRYNVTHAFYTRDHFLQSETRDVNNMDVPLPQTRNSTTHRIGPLAAYTFFERRHGNFNAPTIAAVFNWYLQHPYRTGGDVPGAITPALPYMGVLFSFRFDP